MKTDECKHEWKQEYYGLRCTKCYLFYPDNSNWFAPLDEEEGEYHPYNCTCEDCLQNHPERDILYGDGEYFNWEAKQVTPKFWKVKPIFDFAIHSPAPYIWFAWWLITWDQGKLSIKYLPD